MSGTAPASGVYEFGEFRLDPARRLLARAHGEPVPITGKPFDALAYLVERAGTVVPRRELSQALWPSTVVEDNNLSQTVLALRRALGDTQSAPRFVATIPRRGYQFIAPVRRAPPSAPGAYTPARPGAIAVLPFQNLSPLAEHAYFAAGMHEEVLSRLGRIRGLEVKGRTSVLRYAEGTTPIETIVRELAVAAVLEGSVRYAAERVRVSVRLVDAGGTELWSETYDDELGDVFAIQADIAERIAAALAAELTPAERSSVGAAPTQSLEAYALYLQAVALYRARGGIGVSMPFDVRAEIDRLLGEALALDGRFAAAVGWRAHVALDSLIFDPLQAEDWPRTRAALIERIEGDAARALELEPSQAMAHVILARLAMYRGRLDESLARLERARELRPSDSVVLHYTAMIETLLDRHEAAVRTARRALELDPLNPAPYTPLVLGLRALGDLAGARAAARAAIECVPAAPIGYIHLARTETAGGEPERILEALRIAERFFDDTTRNFRVDAALSYARAGARADAERSIREFERASAGRRIEPGLDAMAALALGQYARARETLEQAVATRASGMDPIPLLLIRRNTWADPVLEQPEWQTLRARLGYERNRG
ncbi:MAG TPA: winged helix-turn-helix domain-containing protein [Gammaproteobacteria bacterium]